MPLTKPKQRLHRGGCIILFAVISSQECSSHKCIAVSSSSSCCVFMKLHVGDTHIYVGWSSVQVVRTEMSEEGCIRTVALAGWSNCSFDRDSSGLGSHCCCEQHGEMDAHHFLVLQKNEQSYSHKHRMSRIEYLFKTRCTA